MMIWFLSLNYFETESFKLGRLGVGDGEWWEVRTKKKL